MPEQHIWHPYCGPAPTPDELLGDWNFDPLLLTLMTAAAVAAWLRTEADRQPLLATAFAVAIVLFVSPLCAWTSALFAIRTVHHLAIVALLAPLLASALRLERLLVFRGLTAWTATALLIFWLWHAPELYAWALRSDAAYWLMQLSLIGSAAGFWAAVRAASVPSAIVALLAAVVSMGLLGALLTFAPALYAPHMLTTAVWGLSPVEDQQLAGLIMWAPGAGIYLAAALALLARLLRSDSGHDWVVP